MRAFVYLLAVVSLCNAKPQAFDDGARPAFFMGGEQYIVGGSDAAPGEFPWQLSLQYGGSHRCGASLLDARYGLCAAHCVDGVLPVSLSVIAGMYRQSVSAGTQTVQLSDYTIHGSYQNPGASYSNDISILVFATLVVIGGDVQPAVLPPNDLVDFAGVTCVLSGWGRTDSSNNLPDVLQKASIACITTTQCQALMGTIGNVWDQQICFYDSRNQVGSCNGDSGGPANCPLVGSGTVVAGITSWGVSSALGNCLQTYPSVYTRVSSYLGWIAANTP